MSLNGLQPGEPTSFVRRFLHWLDVLDPTTLLASDEEIKNSKALLQSVGHITKDAIQNRKVEDAGKLCEVSLHPDTGNIIPTLFRPPAFMPLATPLAIVTFLQHTGTKPAFFWQLLFQSYSAGFNLVNGNKTWKAEKMEPKQCLLFAVSVSYTACIAVTPQFLMNRFKLTSPIMQTFFRRVLPAPLLSLLGAINVGIVRAPEIEHGIEVVDKAGNVVGVSQRAGEKAVRETAMSRAALIGVTALIPAVLQRFLQRF
ncbi:sideroflexin-4 isoform X2 [Ascaphus truei]|uniref:sideroflexin-4 isoform X2 n=1 Tax=Ascaphus truei TaxID=8439 RepID=UPI003F5A6F61